MSRRPDQGPSVELVSEAWKQLVTLRDLTRRTGVLHEAQILHLKIWPRILFERADNVTIRICDVMEPVSEHSVTFEVKLKPIGKRAAIGTMARRYTLLNEWVKALLGDEWSVVIVIDGVRVYSDSGKA